MKITDKHGYVSPTQLDVLIEFAEEDLKEKPGPCNHARLMALLELKHRRAEDRMVEQNEQNT